MDNMSIITQVSKEELRTPLREKGRLSVSSKKLRQRSILHTIFCCLAHSEDDGDQALSNRNNNTSQVPDGKNSTSQTAVDHHLLPEVKVQDSGKKCVVIDLDETLVHSSFKPVSNADFIIPVEIDGNVHQVYVLKRPYVDEFLRRMGELFECVLFTASLSKVPIASWFDDMSDTELLDLIPFFERLSKEEDIFTLLQEHQSR
ncbi:hypothetical protein chiPu_0021211 [Chiloscyllium punctatum]|uniref:Mitochondrial import inner membrane translocase subunit TIM50 n=1 Tax=Chiloscyllium punctatum TaxID=137246 RepID=A0A401RP52_CHIPU|nr:hypothetical protein [Chiloscyllium punctatum]